ncbi:MAG: ATP-binding protein [Salinivirgaceae bacterium]|nr:ATP-binding protein [Salinivirgaceae bacterium]
MALIKRQLHNVIKERMFKGKAIVLIGARQVGKTTLFEQILNDPDIQVPQDQILRLYCDDAQTRAILEQSDNLNNMRMLIANNRIVLVDEAQRIQGIGLILKLITDHFKDIQLLVTGSSSLALQGELNEPLTGRKFEYHLYPISTQELLNNGGLLRVKQSLDARLIYGSYPDVVSSADNVRDILMNLSGSYMYQDLLSMEGVRKPVLLEKLLVALALQVGGVVSYNELAQTIGSDAKTVEKYVDLLEKCYVVFRLNGLSRNLRNELKKSKKIFFFDNGIRNALIHNFNPLDLRDDDGALWENFCIAERIKYNHYNGRFVNQYFWRTSEKQEIDYVEECDGKMAAYEMKSNPNKANVTLPSAFLNAYPVKEASVITPDNYIDWLG